MEAKLLVLCAVLAYAAAGPVRMMTERSDSCAQTCTPSSKFQYRPGQTYTYDYTIQTDTSMDSASQEKAVLVISAQADIEVIDQCDFVLVMNNVRIDESSPSRDGRLLPSPRAAELRRVLEAAPLRFAFQDGVVQELCPDPQDDPWALNIKRGLLSALQNSMDSLQGEQTVEEVDVTGKCPTKYEVTGAGYWGNQNIKRTKDLMACTDRHGYSGSLQAAKYQMASDMQSVPLMSSDHACKQEVSKGVIQRSVCTEKHLFRPFSSEGSGALTTVQQSMTFKTQKSGISARKGWVQSRAEMTFDHGYSLKDSNEARMRTEKLLKTLCEISVKGVQPEVPRVFSQLVGAVQKLDRSNIRDIYQQLQGSQICSMNNKRTKKFFLDALPMAGSSATVDMMKELLVNGDITGMEADLWIASLAFIPQPTAEMIESAQELLKSDSLKLRAMLAVSSMVHNRCQKTECSSLAVDNIVQSLKDTIGRCYVTDGNIKTILTALRAIGNAGQSGAVDTLNTCLHYRVPMEVRVAAAQAFRRMPCDADKRHLTRVVKDKSEDSEIRIAAYLQLMTCPTPDLMTQIQVIIEDEADDSQVGSFIWSHLSNLKETSSPLKQEVKQMLQDIQMKKLFDLNPLKFSRNYEKSAFLRMINSGLQAESDVIWSAESPLPRSVSANLTFDLFGHSVNLLEIGGRLEGVDYLIETLQANIFGDGKDKSAKKNVDELKGSGFARVFGNELAYSRFQGMDSLTSGKTFNLLDFLINLSENHDYTFTQSIQFLDSSITVPTISGLPLTLSVNGTAVVDIKASGSMDLRKVSKSPRSLSVNGEIRPSGAVNIDGEMSVDALVTRTGLKVSGSVHSSMAVKGRVELDRGRVLSVQVDMPDDRLDILDVRTKFFILHNKAESEQKMITGNRKEFEICTGSIGSKISGLELCGQLQFPNASMLSAGPYFPLTGPSSVSLVLHKRDSHSGYKVLAKRVENKRQSIAQLSFDTPGSSVVRAVSFDMMIDYPKNQAEISFASPWKKAALKGSMMNEEGMKSLTGRLDVDDDKVYSVTTEIKVDDQKDQKLMVLTPLVEIRRPGAEKITMIGSVTMDMRGKSMNSDLNLNGATEKPVQVQASYVNNQKEKKVSGSVRYGKETWSAQAGSIHSIRSGKNLQAQFSPVIVVTTPKGDVLKLEGSADFRQNKMLRSDITLTAPDFMDKPANLKLDLIRKERKKATKYNLNLRLKSKPFTGKASGFLNVADALSTKLTVDYNVYRVGRDRITVNGKFSNKSTSAFKKYTLTSSVDFKRNPEWNVQTSLDFDHKKKRTEGEVKVILGKDPKDKDSQLLLSASVNRKVKDVTDMDIDYKMKAAAPMMGIDTTLVGDHSHSPNSLGSKVTLKYGKDGFVTGEVNMKDKSDSSIRLNGDASLAFPGYSYEIDSSVKKSGKQYVHTVNTKTHNGPYMALISTYKSSKDDTHDVTADLRLKDFSPIKMSGTAGLQLDNLQLQGQMLHGKDSYSLNTLSKISRGPRGKWTVEVSYPSRKAAFTAIGGLKKNSADLDLDLAWDKERDDSAKITLSASGVLKNTRAQTSSNAKLELTTPFHHLPRLSASVSYDDDSKRYGLDGKVSTGGKSDTYYSTLDIRKPLSPSNVQLTWQAGTPVKGMKRMDASVAHVADPSSLSTVVKASRGKSQLEVTVTGSNKGSRGSTDVSGDVTIKSELPGMEDVSISAAHKDDGQKYETTGAFVVNKDRYSADLDLTHFRRDWQIQNSGNLKIASPEHEIATNWQHRSSDDDIKSSLNSNWGRGKELKVALSGNKQLGDYNSKVKGAFTVRSPWEPVRDIQLTLKHEHSDGQCKHKAEFVHNGEKKMSTAMNYLVIPSDISGDFALSLPIMEDKSGSLTIKRSGYPVTAHAELQIARGKIIAGDVSYSKDSNIDMDGNLRITTPFEALRAITLSGSTKREGDDILAKAILDYGVRKNYDAEIRIRPDTLSLARITFHTPLSALSSLEAGYRVAGDWLDLDASADLAVEPALGKYSGSLIWQNDDEISGKLRIDTPLRDLRYMQLVASSQETAQGRKSRMEAEYFPRKLYALTSFYSTDLPIIFTLDAETPIPGYNSFGLNIRHQHGDSAINTHGELQYLPERVIESTLALSWLDNMDGSLVVKTPFSGLEESKLSFRHDGDIEDFSSHAEGELMRHTMVADAQFKAGYKSSGIFTLESSLAKEVKAKFSKSGDLENLRGSASAAYGDQEIKGDIQHRMNSRSLSTSVSLNTPFTKVIKSSVELSNKQGIMQGDMSGQYGPKKVEMKNSVSLALPDASMSSSLSYKLDNSGPQEVKLTASKKGEWRSMDLAASLTTPYTQDAALSLRHVCYMPVSYQATLAANYGSRHTIASNTIMENRDNAFSASSVNSYRMDGHPREISASVGKNGDMDDMSVSASAKYNGQEVGLQGQLKQTDGIAANVQVNTPFEDFERLAADMTYSPIRNGFDQQSSVTYMRGKKIQQTLRVENDDLRAMQLDASLTTPIQNLESTALNAQHTYDQHTKECSGSAQITSILGKHLVNYRRVGDWDHMTLDAAVDGNGEKLEGHVDRVPLSNGYKHAIDLKGLGEELQASLELEKTQEKVSGKAAASLAPASISIEGDASMTGFTAELNAKADINTQTRRDTATIALKKTGPLNDITVDMRGALNAKKASAIAEFKNSPGDLSGKVKISTPFEGFTKVGGSFSHSGDLNRFNSQGSVTYLDDQEISTKANFYRYEWSRIEAAAELSTPFSGLESTKAEYRHAGSPDSFTCSSSLEYGDSKKISSDVRAVLDPKYDITLTVKTPFRGYRKMVAAAALESLGNAHSASSSVELVGSERYAIDGSLDMDSIPMTFTGKLTTPIEALGSVEVSGSHHGQLDDFSSSLIFNSPQTDVIKGDAMLTVNSLYDVNGAASFSSQLSGLEDLRAEVKTSDQGSSKTGHAMVRWAPELQVAVDGTYDLKDYWYQKQLMADLTLSTPFQPLRSANMHVQHEQKDSKYSPKVELTLNGDTLLDAEGELTIGDSPAMSLTSRKPLPAQLTGSLNMAGAEKEGEIFFNWNRDESDKNVRVQTKVKDITDDKDFSVKMILPYRTVSSGVTLKKQDTALTSEGYLSWDDRADRKVFYTVQLNDNSQYYRKVYDGSVKVGVPARTLEGSGSYSHSQQTSALDGTFSWDAERDVTKQVGFQAKLTNGDKTKADLKFLMPAIGKEVHIDHEMEVNQGRTVWDGRTQLSYSKDSRRKLTVASSLKDVSASFQSGQNYSLAVAISHPHTKTDISFTSHIGATGERYSAAMDTVYLTSQSERKMMALRGEIDRLRRQIDLELVSPMKKMSMRGEVQSTEPYLIRLVNTYDDSEIIESQLKVDPEARSVQFITNYDLDNPENQLILQAGYVNASAFSAELYRQQRDRKISDALLATRLNTSTLLHTRLAWRPQSIDDMESYARGKTISYSDNIRKTLESATSATGRELSDKYATITEELYSELSPVLDLAHSELSRLGQQLEKSRKQLSRMYRNNDFYLQNIGDSASELIVAMKDYNDAYKEAYDTIIGDIRGKLQDIKDYDIRQQYEKLVEDIAEQIALAIARSTEWVEEGLAELDEELMTLKGQAADQWEELKNHPRVQQIKKRVQLLGHDYKWLAGYVSDRVQKFNIPEQYTSAIYSARDTIANGLVTDHVKTAQEVANEIYQQGAWAYQYWQVEKNAQKHAASILKMAKELAAQQLEKLTEKFSFLKKSKVTVYDPEQGEIQVEVFLPVALKSLQELPDLSFYVKQADDVMDRYVPDKDTVLHYYNQYAPWLNNASAPENGDMMAQFETYQPSQRAPRYLSRRNRVQGI
ncbi:uncharacterized protein [Littorina saxatilis]|uniref:uncharacterized protein isoform X1 n=1 Tax=Littorina saxatilis TaxID=31220 RepID=UPI0038B4B456